MLIDNTSMLRKLLLIVLIIPHQFLHAELIPILTPTLNPVTNKFIGKSVISDSIDNKAKGHQFRDRIYYYDFDLDSSGKAYVLYAQPKPQKENSSQPVDFTKEKSDIILAIETETGWDKHILSTEGVFEPTGLQIKVDNQDNFHLIYVRKLEKTFSDEQKTVDYLVYRKVSGNQISDEIEVGNINSQPANFSGLGGWRTFMAIAPDDSVYMIREGANDDLTKPELKILIPNEDGNWNQETVTGLPEANWYRLGKFLIDKNYHAHIIYTDYAYDDKAQPYIANDYHDLDLFGFHNLWYAESEQLNGKNWNSTLLKEDDEPALNNYQFWPDLALDKNNNPAIATWLWNANTRFPGYDSSTVFFQRDSKKNWSLPQTTTRIFENLSYQPDGQLAGMGPGIIHDQTGWHGVWDSSHPRPFEHDYERGGIMYRFSPNGKNWDYYQPIAEFSAEGFCIVKIDSQNRMNILVLGDHTDTQLYFLRYQLPNSNLMEIYPDRQFYYSNESITLKARIEPGAIGDFFVAIISTPRPEINQKSEIWQLTPNLTWEKIDSLAKLKPVISISLLSALNFNDTIDAVLPNQEPFGKLDTDYVIYSLVTKPNSSPFEEHWVTPLFSRRLTANKTIPK